MPPVYASQALAQLGLTPLPLLSGGGNELTGSFQGILNLPDIIGLCFY